MNETVINHSQEPVIRFVDVCPECGYSLAGSPDEGLCPECGEHYDQNVMILHGAAMGQRANLANASARQMKWLLLGTVLQFWYIFPNWRFLLHEPAYLVILGIWIIACLSLLIKRCSNQRPGLIKIYLSPKGCLQTDNTTQFAAVSIAMRMIWPILLLAALAWVQFAMKGVERASSSTLLIFILLIVAWRVRRKIIQPPPQPVPPAQALAATGHRWNGGEEWKFKPTKPGHARLRIWQKVRWYEFQGDFVDAEIECDAARCEQIDKLILAWIRAARHDGNSSP